MANEAPLPPIVTLDDVNTLFDVDYAWAPEASSAPPEGETLAVAMAVYDSVGWRAYNNHRMLMIRLARTYPKDQLWIAPVRGRLAYPLAPLYAIATIFKLEQRLNRRCDWIFWLDDDVLVPMDIVERLREVADPERRPFVAAPPNDRHAPFRPAVWMFDEDKTYRWHDPPKSGVYEVDAVGLCAALFHRSLFDRVEQPWFAAGPRTTEENGSVHWGWNPDSWWSYQLRKAGIPIIVNCDTEVTHLGDQLALNPRSVPVLRQITKAPPDATAEHGYSSYFDMQARRVPIQDSAGRDGPVVAGDADSGDPG